MLINGIKATNYKAIADSLLLYLTCTADEALAIDSSIIKVTTDDGDFVESFVGYAKQNVTVDAATGSVTLRLVCGAEGALIAAMQALQVQNDDLQAQVEEQAAAIEELATILSEGDA